MRRLLLVTAGLLLGLWTHAAHAQCPAAIPSPANSTMVHCFTDGKPVSQRCATVIDSAQCDIFNTNANNAGSLTPDGYATLQSIGFCAIPAPIGLPPRILDFCPRGCTPPVCGWNEILCGSYSGCQLFCYSRDWTPDPACPAQ